MGAEGILGAGMGLVGTLAGMDSQEQAMQDQWRLEKEKMALQAKYTSEAFLTESYEGETMEAKVQRVVINKEPIEDGAPIIYTEKKDGVLPQYNIRTAIS